MKLNKFAYLYSKPLGNHTLKIMKKYLEIYFKKPGKIMEISWNFVSPKKWEPLVHLHLRFIRRDYCLNFSVRAVAKNGYTTHYWIFKSTQKFTN